MGCVQTLQASYEDEEDAYHSSMHPDARHRPAENDHYRDYDDHYDERYPEDSGDRYENHYEPYDVDYNQSSSARDLDYYSGRDRGDHPYTDSPTANNDPTGPAPG